MFWSRAIFIMTRNVFFVSIFRVGHHATNIEINSETRRLEKIGKIFTFLLIYFSVKTSYQWKVGVLKPRNIKQLEMTILKIMENKNYAINSTCLCLKVISQLILVKPSASNTGCSLYFDPNCGPLPAHILPEGSQHPMGSTVAGSVPIDSVCGLELQVFVTDTCNLCSSGWCWGHALQMWGSHAVPHLLKNCLPKR